MTPRLPALDGVRAIAILLVIPHNLNLIAEPVGGFAHVLVSCLDRGWIGVQLFFVLSGFLITGILLDTRGTPGYLRSFFLRRALRILPLYYATLLLVFVCLSAAGLRPASLPRSFGSELSYWLLFSNWYAPLHQGQGSMPHLWSLSVEEQFYLLWPFLVWRHSPIRVHFLCIGVAALSLGIRVLMLMVGAPTEAIYEFSVSRMDALALGGAAAAAMRVPQLARHIASQRRSILVTAISVLLGGAALTRGYTSISANTLSFGYSLLALSFSLVVLLAAHTADSQAQAWVAFLQLPWLRRIGKYSYAMYLLHLPLHILVGLRLLQALGYERNASVLVQVVYLLLGITLSYIAAAAAYRTIEAPFLKLKDQL